MKPAVPTMRAFGAMGTRFECVLAGFDCAMGGSHSTAAAEEVERIVTEWHDLLSAFDPASAVSRINAGAGRGVVRVPGELMDLFARTMDYTRETRGAFDITLGSLMARSGFRGEDRGGGGWGMDALVLDERAGTAALAREGVRLDLGGIAKGFVLDLCASELRELGVTSALLHGGTSSAIAIGGRPDGEPWRVKVSCDLPGAPVIELADSAMSVSEARGRMVEGKGHILDPRRGESAEGVELACVFGPWAEVCEVWSTAIVVDPGLMEDLPVGYGGHAMVRGRWVSSEERILSV